MAEEEQEVAVRGEKLDDEAIEGVPANDVAESGASGNSRGSIEAVPGGQNDESKGEQKDGLGEQDAPPNAPVAPSNTSEAESKEEKKEDGAAAAETKEAEKGEGAANAPTPGPEEESKGKDDIDAATMTPRSLKRHQRKEARKKAKADREAARKKATEERKKKQEEMKKLSGKERDAARREIQQAADKTRAEQEQERQADWAVQEAAREEKKVDKATEEYMKKKELERQEAERKRKEAEAIQNAIKSAVREGDRYSSKCQMSVKKVGTYAWTGWHNRFISLGYREFRVYKKKKHLEPGQTIYVAPGSLIRYIPKLQPWGDGPIHHNNLEIVIATHEKNDAKKGLVQGKTARERHRNSKKIKPGEKQQRHVLRIRLSFPSEKIVIRWMFALIEFIPSVFSLLQNNRSPIMDQVRGEVVEEAMAGKVKLERKGKHDDLRSFLTAYGEDEQYIGRRRLMKDLYLTNLVDPDIERVLRSWPRSLALFLKPKHFKHEFETLTKSKNIFARASWDHLVAYTGLSRAMARESMNKDTTRLEMLNASETRRKAELEKIAVQRELRMAREKKEAKEQERQKAIALKRKQKAMADAAREEAERLKREAKLVVPHTHLHVKIPDANPTGDAYCPVCRQLAWQTQHDQWQSTEKTARNRFDKMVREAHGLEETCRMTFDLQQKKAWLLPGTKEEKRLVVKDEKRRRKKYDRTRQKKLKKENGRRAGWNKADDRYRKEELKRRDHEDKVVRHYRTVRSYYLQAIVKFRDRGTVRRFLWQNILDPVHIISTSAMRHHVFDEALESFFMINIIACESQVNVDQVVGRTESLRLKTLGTRCTGLVRVRDAFVQASEGHLGSRGFTILIINEFCPRGNLRDAVINAPSGADPVSELEMLHWAHSVALALAHMHNVKHGNDGEVVHGNIQPSNILLTANKGAKLGDFPFPRTPDILNLRNLSKAKDIWDFGCTFYSLMTKGAIVQLDIKGRLKLPIDRLLRTVPVRFGSCLREVLSLCLRTNERKRGTAAEIFQRVDTEIKNREEERLKREFRLLLLQKCLNLMLDGNDGVISKNLFYKRLSDGNDLRFTGILGQDHLLVPLLNVAKYEPIVKRTKTAKEGFINCTEILEIMEQAEATRRREEAAKKREAELAARFEMEAVSGDVAMNKFA